MLLTVPHRRYVICVFGAGEKGFPRLLSPAFAIHIALLGCVALISISPELPGMVLLPSSSISNSWSRLAPPHPTVTNNIQSINHFASLSLCLIYSNLLRYDVSMVSCLMCASRVLNKRLRLTTSFPQHQTRFTTTTAPIILLFSYTRPPSPNRA